MKVVHAVLFSILASCTGTAVDNSEVQPNIILFLVDDMGWQDTSVPFWKEATELAKHLGSYLRSVNAQRPLLKATGIPVPWPDEVQF